MGGGMGGRVEDAVEVCGDGAWRWWGGGGGGVGGHSHYCVSVKHTDRAVQCCECVCVCECYCFF